MTHAGSPARRGRGRWALLLGLVVGGAVVIGVVALRPWADPAPGASDTRFGASVHRGPLSWSTAVARADDRYGGLDVVRVFYPELPQDWPGRAGEVERPIVVSFKADPADVLTGRHDRLLRRWFAAAPTDRDVWWSYFHEPEDDVEAGAFTAEEWRAAFRRLDGLAAQAENPRLRTTSILMCWTVDERSGRSFDDYFLGADVVDVLGWDCYSRPTKERAYSDPGALFEQAVTASRELGIPWGIAETGSQLAPSDPSGQQRADWLRDVGRWLAAEGAEFVTYFDSIVGGEFRLLDAPSQQAWREVVTSYGPSRPPG